MEAIPLLSLLLVRKMQKMNFGVGSWSCQNVNREVWDPKSSCILKKGICRGSYRSFLETYSDNSSSFSRMWGGKYFKLTQVGTKFFKTLSSAWILIGNSTLTSLHIQGHMKQERGTPRFRKKQ